MGYHQYIDKVLNSSTLSSSLFLLGGCYKTYNDYKEASPKYKDKFLIKDTLILTGASVGMLANQGISHKIVKSNTYNKAIKNISHKFQQINLKKGIKTSIHYTNSILKELTNGFMATLSGVIGALGADYLLSKTEFEQPKMSKKIIKETEKEEPNELEKQVAKIADEETMDILYSSMIDMSKAKFLSAGMLGSDAIELAQDRKLENKLQHATGYLVNDTLVPLFLLTTANTFTKGMRSLYKIPIIFTSLFSGTLIAHKLFDKHTQLNK